MFRLALRLVLGPVRLRLHAAPRPLLGLGRDLLVGDLGLLGVDPVPNDLALGQAGLEVRDDLLGVPDALEVLEGDGLEPLDLPELVHALVGHGAVVHDLEGQVGRVGAEEGGQVTQ